MATIETDDSDTREGTEMTTTQTISYRIGRSIDGDYFATELTDTLDRDGDVIDRDVYTTSLETIDEGPEAALAEAIERGAVPAGATLGDEESSLDDEAVDAYWTVEL